MNECRARAQKGTGKFRILSEFSGNNRNQDQCVSLHQELADDIQSGLLDGVLFVWSYAPPMDSVPENNYCWKASPRKLMRRVLIVFHIVNLGLVNPRANAEIPHHV